MNFQVVSGKLPFNLLDQSWWEIAHKDDKNALFRRFNGAHFSDLGVVYVLQK